MKKKKEEEFERDVEAGNVTNFEFVLGDGNSETINITEQRIQKILQKKIEAEKKKKLKESKLNNKTKEDNILNSDL